MAQKIQPLYKCIYKVLGVGFFHHTLSIEGVEFFDLWFY